MLPSDLNKFKKYIHSTCTFNDEELAELLVLINEDTVRSKFIITLTKLGKISRPVKPTVEVKEYMTTKARYVEKKIVITSYYANHTQHYLLGNHIQKISKKIGSAPIVLYEEYHPPVTKDTGISEALKTSN